MAKSFDRPPRRTSYPTQPGGIYSRGSTPGLPIPIPVEIAPHGDLTREQAEAEDRAIEADGRRLGERLLAFKAHNGWKVLGYPSWKAYVEQRLSRSLSAVNRQLQAAQARLDLNPDIPDHTSQDSAFCAALDDKVNPPPVKPKRLTDSEARERARAEKQQARESDPESCAIDRAISEALTCSRCGQPLPTGARLDPGPDA
jgi:integrase